MAGSETPARAGGARRAPRSVRLSRRERRRLEKARQQGGKRALRSREAPSARRAADVQPAPAVTDVRAAGGADPRPASGGRRARRPAERRTKGLPGTLGLTFLGAVVPGSGYLYARRRLAGVLVILGWAGIGAAVVWEYGRGWQGKNPPQSVLDMVFDPLLLKLATAVIAVLLLIWLFVVWTSYRLVRPRERPRWHTIVGNVAVVVICVVVAAPVIQAGRYAMATARAVDEVFEDNETFTAPKDVTEADPWGGRDRVNVLLLGGDGAEGRDGVRTDSMILLSMDTATGKAVTFSLPRNMANAQFPEDSPLHDLYPEGFSNGDPASGEYMLNAVYRNVPALHPGVLGNSTNEGADAIKQAVEGSLGIPVEYYVLVNLEGFKQVVDALGGVTVNINEPVAIGGNTDAGIPPDGYLQPGPDQHLNGFQALWFSRGRWESDDYERMERQRCMVDAIVEAADPANLLLRYLDLLEAGREIVFTDIPRELASAFVDLALEVKSRKIKSVVFKPSEHFSSYDPDFDWMRETVQKAIDPPPRDPSTGKRDNPAENPEDACAYNPTGESVTAAE